MKNSLDKELNELFDLVMECEINDLDSVLEKMELSERLAADLIEMFRFTTALAASNSEQEMVEWLARRGLAVANQLKVAIPWELASLLHSHNSLEGRLRTRRSLAATLTSELDKLLVQKFNPRLIEEMLARNKWRYLQNGEGKYLLRFEYAEEPGCSLDVYLVADPESPVYTVRIFGNRPILSGEFEKVLGLCNEFNTTHRWPKAYLRVNETSKSPTGNLELEHQINLEAGIHPALLENFTDCAITGAINFWKWAHTEKGL